MFRIFISVLLLTISISCSDQIAITFVSPDESIEDILDTSVEDEEGICEPPEDNHSTNEETACPHLRDEICRFVEELVNLEMFREDHFLMLCGSVEFFRFICPGEQHE